MSEQKESLPHLIRRLKLLLNLYTRTSNKEISWLKALTTEVEKIKGNCHFGELQVINHICLEYAYPRQSQLKFDSEQLTFTIDPFYYK